MFANKKRILPKNISVSEKRRASITSIFCLLPRFIYFDSFCTKQNDTEPYL